MHSYATQCSSSEKSKPRRTSEETDKMKRWRGDWKRDTEERERTPSAGLGSPSALQRGRQTNGQEKGFEKRRKDARIPWRGLEDLEEGKTRKNALKCQCTDALPAERRGDPSLRSRRRHLAADREVSGELRKTRNRKFCKHINKASHTSVCLGRDSTLASWMEMQRDEEVFKERHAARCNSWSRDAISKGSPGRENKREQTLRRPPRAAESSLFFSLLFRQVDAGAVLLCAATNSRRSMVAESVNLPHPRKKGKHSNARVASHRKGSGLVKAANSERHRRNAPREIGGGSPEGRGTQRGLRTQERTFPKEGRQDENGQEARAVPTT
uniref:Uncharacterized protein n=1 Tax=Toxoplasma gondii TgCATBr9 TaxID=943120 RepID=A0A2T6J4K5_TOXGO|nr:hypothetical protein TGBR9_380580 [Toxoplasma gondii TgCATBr9]